MTSDASIVISVRSDLNGARVVKRSLDDIAGSGDKVTSSVERAERQIKSLDRAGNVLKNTFAGLITVMSAAKILKIADSYQVLQARIQGATRATGDAAKVSEQLFSVSQKTGSALENNVRLFQRLTIGAQELGKTNDQIITLTETVSQLGLLGGASTVAMAAGTMQFSQAMAGGILRAEEFNSIMENIPEVGAAIAKGMDLTVGGLRQAVLEGRVLAKDVFDSLSSQSAEIARRFAEMPMSLGRAVEMAKNAVQKYLGEIDASVGGTQSLAESIAFLAENVDTVGQSLTLVAGVGLAAVIARSGQAAGAFISQSAAARAAAIATLDVAKANQAGALAAYNMARASVYTAQTQTTNAVSARALAVANTQLAAASTAVAASTVTLRGAGAAALAMMGGWPGVILAAVAAIVIFRKDIMEALDKVEVFGEKVGDVFRDIAHGAKIIFAGVAGFIASTFTGLKEAIEGIGQSVNLSVYNSIKNIPGMSGVSDAILEDLSKPGNFEKAGRSFGENFKRGWDRSDSKFDKWLSDDMLGDFVKKGVKKTPIEEGANGAADALNKTEENYKKLQRAIEQGRTPEQDLIARLKELESMRPFAKTAEDVAGLENAIGNARKELDKLRIDAEKNSPLGKAFASIANEIEDGFKDAFKGAFTESDGGWKKLLEGWKATFKNFLAELAYQALARPIILSVVAGVGSGMGLSSGAVGSVVGEGGGFSGMLGNLGSMGSSFLNGGLYSSTLGNIGAKVGATLFAGGDLLSKSAFLGSQAFGNMGYGMLGGFAANLLGLGGGTGGMIGGTLGSLAGGAAGASMGTILGMAGGPIGAIAGSFLGTALGGMFGGGVPRQTLGVGIAPGSDGLLKLSEFNTKGADKSQAQEFGNQIVAALNNFAAAVGGRFNSGIAIETNIGEKDPGTWANGVKVSGSAGDAQAAIMQILRDPKEFSLGSSQLSDVMRRSLGMSSDLNQVASDLQFAKEIFGLIENVDPLTQALEAINDQFETMYDRAEKLGLPMEKVNEIIDKQKQLAIDSVKAQQAGFATMEQMISTFKSFLDGQALGSNSSLSPMGKLELAQGNFGSLLSKAQGGDLSVTQDLLRAANELLNIGRGVYASSVSFAGLESFVRTSITEIARTAGVPGYATGVESAPAGLAWVGERGPELVRFRGGERVYNAGESAAIANGGARSDAQMMAYFAEWSEEQRNTQKETVKTRKAIERLTSMLASQRRA